MQSMIITNWHSQNMKIKTSNEAGGRLNSFLMERPFCPYKEKHFSSYYFYSSVFQSCSAIKHLALLVFLVAT